MHPHFNVQIYKRQACICTYAKNACQHTYLEAARTVFDFSVPIPKYVPTDVLQKIFTDVLKHAHKRPCVIMHILGLVNRTQAQLHIRVPRKVSKHMCRFTRKHVAAEGRGSTPLRLMHSHVQFMPKHTSVHAFRHGEVHS